METIIDFYFGVGAFILCSFLPIPVILCAGQYQDCKRDKMIKRKMEKEKKDFESGILKSQPLDYVKN